MKKERFEKILEGYNIPQEVIDNVWEKRQKSVELTEEKVRELAEGLGILLALGLFE